MYILVVSISIGIFVILALSLNIITGYAGQPSIGHAAFFGIGAYFSAVMTSTYGISFWLAMPVSALLTGLIGALLGLTSMRVKDDFLAITTIGINFVVVAVFQYVPFFGASLGMSVTRPKLFGKIMGNVEIFALVCLVILLVCVFMLILKKSWFGLALASIRNDETAASSFGVDILKFKVLAFAMGTAIAGLAGAIYAIFMTFISSGDFGFLVSVSIVSMVVIGGVGTIRGSIFGAVILGLLPELFRFISDYRILVYGALLVLMMRFQPQGLLGEDSFIVNAAVALFRPASGKGAVRR
jgi:branched-chain amino acid transport system permease protein